MFKLRKISLNKLKYQCCECNDTFSYENNREGFTFIFNRSLVNDKLTEDEKKMLNVLKNNLKMSVFSMAQIISMSEKTMQKSLKSLKEKRIY